jgi:hypothetical protein
MQNIYVRVPKSLSFLQLSISGKKLLTFFQAQLGKVIVEVPESGVIKQVLSAHMSKDIPFSYTNLNIVLISNY